MAYGKVTSKPAANTLTTLYTVGAVSGTASLIICNTGKTTTFIDVAISATATPTAAEYIAQSVPITSGEVKEFKDLVLIATENVVIRSGTSDITYRLQTNLA